MQASDEKTPLFNKPKRWLEIFVFWIIIAVVLKVLSIATDPIAAEKPELYVSRDRNAMAGLMEEPDTLDVLVVGDSEAMVMVSPSILMDEAGISSFNCNQLGQRIYETYHYLQKILEKQHPQVIIIETNIIIHEVSVKIEPQLAVNALAEETFPFLRYHNNWRWLAGLTPADEYEADRGFEPVEVIKPYSGDQYMFETDESLKLDPITIYYLNKIDELLKEKGIDYIFVSSPSSVNMDYPKHNVIQAYADAYGVDFIDFNLMTDEIGLDWSKDTGDSGDHINTYGTDKTTKYLMNYLKENYDLPDHRND